MEELSVHYHGFSPSSAAESAINGIMRELLEESPSSASLRATISKDGEAYKGIVTISSHAGRFFAIGSSESLVELGHMLTARMRRQLDRWKSRRFKRRDRRVKESSHGLLGA